jgi:polysaccharide export outer membrane protein
MLGAALTLLGGLAAGAQELPMPRAVLVAVTQAAPTPPPPAKAKEPAAKKETPKTPPKSATDATSPVPASVPLPPDYVIGPEDVLAILFWRDKDMSVDQVMVRPDGMITLPLINDLKAAGLTPDEFRDAIIKEATQYVADPNVSVVVKEINSRKVFVTGQVAKPGSFSLTSPTTVIQALAMAGGLTEFAKKDDIAILRTFNGKTQRLRFNYNEVIEGKKLEQNVLLRPGDTVVVR